MNVNWSGESGFMAVLGVFSTLLAVVTAIFWMIVGWRAMRAHERIADTLERKP